jgi:hypothetical protein
MKFIHGIFVINISKFNKFAIYKKGVILVENSTPDGFGSISLKEQLFVVGGGTEIGQNSLSLLLPTWTDFSRPRVELEKIIVSIVHARIGIRTILPILNVRIRDVEKRRRILSFISASSFTEFLYERTRGHNDKKQKKQGRVIKNQ